MPKLPDVTSLGERPVPRPQGGVASYDAGADSRARANLGATIYNIGEELHKKAEIERQKNDETLAEDALNRLRERELDLRYGEKNGFTNIKGMNAVRQPLVQDYSKRFDDSVMEISSSLLNDRQKDLFKKRANVIGSAYKGSLSIHTAREREVASNEAFERGYAVELQTLLSSLGDKNARAAASGRLEGLIANQVAAGRTPEWAAERRANADAMIATGMAQNVNGVIDAASRDSLADPNLASDRFSAIEKHINELGIKNQTLRGTLIERARKEIANASIAGWIRQNPNDAHKFIDVMLSDVDAGKKPTVEVNISRADGTVSKTKLPWGMLDAKEQLHWAEYAKTAANQQGSSDRNKLAIELRDYENASRSGIITPPMPVERFGVIKDEADRKRLYDEHLSHYQLANNKAKLSALPIAEQAALVASQKPTTAQGFTEKQQNFISLQQAFEANIKQIEKDPADYAVRTNDAVRVADTNYMAAPNDSALAQSYAREVAANHERIGIAGAPVLTNQMAQSIANAYSDGKNKGQLAAQFIRSERDKWGAYWPQISRDLGKHLSDTARVVAENPDRKWADDLSAIEAVKTDELKKPLETSVVGTIDAEIESGMRDFVASLRGTGADAEMTIARYSDAAKRLAYRDAAGAASPAGIGKKVVRQMIEDQYDFQPQGANAPYRVPKDKNISVNAISRGTRWALDTIQNVQLELPQDAERMFGEKFTKETFANLIKRNGYFRNDGDDSGLFLFVDGRDGRARPVLAPSGVPVFYTWETLARNSVPVPTQQRGAPAGFVENQGRGEDRAATGVRVPR